MTTWEEIRDEIAGMLADGKPLEDVISKLDEMNKPKPMTNEQWLKQANTEQLAEFLADKFNEVVDFILHEVDENAEDIEPDDYWYRQDVVAEWLKQPHTIKE